MKLIDYKLKDFIEELASGSPAPGGGSVAGLGAGLSAALISMVINLTNSPELAENLDTVNSLREESLALIDEDADSFNQVMAAFRMPKETKEQREERSRAIRTAIKKATLTPLQTMKTGLKLLKIGREVIEKGNPNAISDIGVAGLMGLAAIKAGYYNVIINTSSLQDKKETAALEEEAQNILQEGERLAGEMEEITLKKIKG